MIQGLFSHFAAVGLNDMVHTRSYQIRWRCINSSHNVAGTFATLAEKLKISGSFSANLKNPFK